MAKSGMECKIAVEHIRYAFIFFPVATYAKVGDVSALTVFGLTIYQSVGNAYQWLWFKPKER